MSNYYDLMGLSPSASPIIITKMFHILCKMYHPDNHISGDNDLFIKMKEAYEHLSDPVKREVYDKKTFGESKYNNTHPDNETNEPLEKNAIPSELLSEQEIRWQLLINLYNQRRNNPFKPELDLPTLSEALGLTLESIQFCVWYLKEKRFMQMGDSGEITISIEGVDFVEKELLGTNTHNNPYKNLSLPES